MIAPNASCAAATRARSAPRGAVAGDEARATFELLLKDDPVDHTPANGSAELRLQGAG